MIEVNVYINREHRIASLNAIRKSPLGKPSKNQKCQYDLRIDTIVVDTFVFPYGDGVALAIHMLELYKANKHNYDAMILYQITNTKGK